MLKEDQFSKKMDKIELLPHRNLYPVGEKLHT